MRRRALADLFERGDRVCGIAGAWDPARRGDLEATLRRMTSTLAHRGPDDGGVLLDEATGLGLGHRRLSILDLSPSGHQPMLSRSGRFAITFNGEVYNYLELRAQLPGARWAG